MVRVRRENLAFELAFGQTCDGFQLKVLAVLGGTPFDVLQKFMHRVAKKTFAGGELDHPRRNEPVKLPPTSVISYRRHSGPHMEHIRSFWPEEPWPNTSNKKLANEALE